MTFRPSPRVCIAVCIGLVACAETDFAPIDQPSDWTEVSGARWRAVAVDPGGAPGFTRVPVEWSGVEFENRLAREALAENQMRANGSGVAVGDVDGDGRPDIYFARLDGPNILYRNLGDWRFEDITQSAGLSFAERFSTGVTFADLDGDGDLDLVATSLGGGKTVAINDGTGRFEPAAELGEPTGATSIAVADVNGDSRLDVYVTNYKATSVLDLFGPEQRAFGRTVREVDGRFEIIPEFAEHYELVFGGGEARRLELGEPDELFIQTEDGGFESARPATAFAFADGQVREELPREWGLAARFGDLNGDGHVDLFVANDLHSPDRIWYGDGTGHFVELPPANARTTSASTMAIDFSDLDRNGTMDAITVDMLSRSTRLLKTQDPVARVERGLPGEETGTQQVARNVLLTQRHDGTFADVGRFAGVDASEWSWSIQFLDVDLDGYEDVLIPNGHVLDLMDADTQIRLQRAFIGDWRETSLFYEPLPLANVAFRNRGDLTFEDVSETWGFGEEDDISHGLATADFDGDGDLDVVVTRLDQPALLLRNDASAPRIAVRLAGDDVNRQGVGARVSLAAPGLPLQTKEIAAGGGYLSGSEALAVFAAGTDGEGARIEVRWPDGRVSVVEEAAPNRLYEVDQSAAGAAGAESPGPPARGTDVAGVIEGAAVAPGDVAASDGAPLFERVDFTGLHDETVYDDFARQPLLPMRLSQMGPSLAWHDLDADGDPDLVVTAGAGSPPALYRNDGGSLRRVALAGPEVPVDQSGVIPLPDDRGHALLAIGLSNYEAPASETGAVPSLIGVDLASGALAGPTAPASFLGLGPPSESATGPIAAGDVNLDGLLDLFVGGRVVPGRYPEAASSRLLMGQERGGFAPRPEPLLEGIGLVSGAVFSDIDADGDPDLVLAIEWGPVRVLRNDSGQFMDATEELGLGRLQSRWNAVTTGDFNADGLPDIVATSWGRNTEYRPTEDTPLLAYFEDVDRNGTFDVIEAQYDARLRGVAPLAGYKRLTAGLPGVASVLPTHGEYADATLIDALGSEPGGRVEATGLAHTVFWNRGTSFVAAELPSESQWAPSMGATVADFDGDGFDDLFLAQNFFATDEDSPRYDAGQGLWLRSLGDESFEPRTSVESGVRLSGDQRGPAVADIDGDARVDLSVGQNGGAVALYRNVGGSPGLRVRVSGPPGNPFAVGVSMRLVYEGSFGPRREVRAGSGAGSHDELVLVLGVRDGARALEVLWPGGVVETIPLDAAAIAAGDRDLTVTRPGMGGR